MNNYTPSCCNFLMQDCDSFTRNFLTKLGVRVAEPLDTPGDPYTKYRKEVSKLIFCQWLDSMPA